MKDYEEVRNKAKEVGRGRFKEEGKTINMARRIKEEPIGDDMKPELV